MRILTYLSVFLLALGATCTSDSKNREIPPQTKASDTSSEASANRQENKNGTGSQLRKTQAEELDTLYLISGTEPFWILTLPDPTLYIPRPMATPWCLTSRKPAQPAPVRRRFFRFLN